MKIMFEGMEFEASKELLILAKDFISLMKTYALHLFRLNSVLHQSPLGTDLVEKWREEIKEEKTAY